MEIVRDYLRLIKNEFYILKELSAFESATAGLVEVWDYPDCVGLCQFGCAFTTALTRGQSRQCLEFGPPNSAATTPVFLMRRADEPYS